MRSILICLLGIAGSILGTAMPVPAEAQLPPDMLTVYSNICFNPMSGDLNGLRIIVFRSATWRGGEAKPPSDDTENIYVFFQRTAGLLTVPLQAPATVQGDIIHIGLQFPDRSTRTFVGRITPETIEGRYTDDRATPYLLKRNPAPINKFSTCTG